MGDNLGKDGGLCVRRRRGNSRVIRGNMPAVVPDDCRCVGKLVGWEMGKVRGRLRVILGKILRLVATARTIVVFDFQLQHHLDERFLVYMVGKKWGAVNKYLHE